MRRLSRIGGWGALTLVLLLSAVVANGAMAPAGDAGPDPAQRTFRVRGSISGLVAGHTSPMRVRIRNRDDVPILVRRVGAVVTSPRPSCPAGSLLVSTWRGERRIPPKARRRVVLMVKLRAGAPSECYGMGFTLHYTGRAVRAVPR